jgi:hypothetical protein
LSAEGSWERVLLADSNIGIGGDPVRALRRVADLAPGGIVVAEIDPPSAAVGQGNVALGNVPSRRALVSLVVRQRRGAW